MAERSKASEALGHSHLHGVHVESTNEQVAEKTWRLGARRLTSDSR